MFKINCGQVGLGFGYGYGYSYTPLTVSPLYKGTRQPTPVRTSYFKTKLNTRTVIPETKENVILCQKARSTIHKAKPVPDELRCCATTMSGTRCQLRKCAKSNELCYIHHRKYDILQNKKEIEREIETSKVNVKDTTVKKCWFRLPFRLW